MNKDVKYEIMMEYVCFVNMVLLYYNIDVYLIIQIVYSRKIMAMDVDFVRKGFMLGLMEFVIRIRSFVRLRG